MTAKEKQMLMEILLSIVNALDILADKSRNKDFREDVEAVDQKYEIFREYVIGNVVKREVA